MRRAAKKDANHNAISDVFKAMGCSVLDLSRVGDDCPDILIGLPGVNVLVEIKNKDARGALTPGQERFIRDWSGPVEVCWTEEQAIEIVQKYRARWRR